ncbi:unnamed protein product [Dibothriocephalus latus]|uniref:Uncharacterized protein n=1 Tax=Dibothriocephalus latus TaxID=60516 RepID=A0A3P7NV77_DIBLA|nr:unnamed protein product [Dibothriocephalus latus]
MAALLTDDVTSLQIGITVPGVFECDLNWGGFQEAEEGIERSPVVVNINERSPSSSGLESSDERPTIPTYNENEQLLGEEEEEKKVEVQCDL